MEERHLATVGAMGCESRFDNSHHAGVRGRGRGRPVSVSTMTRIRRAAWPSPTLKAEKSRLQARHLGANVTKPLKSDFSPQRGQSPLRAASTTPLPLAGGAGGGVFMFTDSAWTGPPLDPLPRTEGESQ